MAEHLIPAADLAEACADVDKGDLEFVFESVEIFVSRENVSDEDIAEWLTYVENWSLDENPVELDFVDDEVIGHGDLEMLEKVCSENRSAGLRVLLALDGVEHLVDEGDRLGRVVGVVTHQRTVGLIRERIRLVA